MASSNFQLHMSLPAMSFGDSFCMSRKGGTRGGGWVHLQGANGMAMSELNETEPLTCM